MPLSTLRWVPHGTHRRTWGQDGSRSLSCETLAFPTSCRFIPAHRLYPCTRHRTAHLSSAHRARAGFAPQRLRPGMLQHGRDATNRGAPRRSSRTRSRARGHPPPPYAPASCVGRSGGPPSRAPSTTGPTRPGWSEPSRADSPGAGSRPHGGRGRRRRSSPGARAGRQTSGAGPEPGVRCAGSCRRTTHAPAQGPHGLTCVIPAGRIRGARDPRGASAVPARHGHRRPGRRGVGQDRRTGWPPLPLRAGPARRPGLTWRGRLIERRVEAHTGDDTHGGTDRLEPRPRGLEGSPTPTRSLVGRQRRTRHTACRTRSHTGRGR
jgi:hypothetical protein